MKSDLLPQSVLRLMSAADRQRLGKAGFTVTEASQATDRRAEKELQADMCRLLDQRGLFFSRARMDKKTSVRVGMFDFSVYLPSGKFLAVEAKVAGGRLSLFQEKLFAEFWAKTGSVVHIVLNLDMFRALLDQHAPPP